MLILGLSAYYHDSAAALLQDGNILAAAQEERFSRSKHDSSFPIQAIAACLSQSRISPSQIDYVAFYDKPLLKFERLIETYLAFAPSGFSSFRVAIPAWLREKLFLRDLLLKELRGLDPAVSWDNRLLFSEHHVSHAASAFFASPFNDAAVLTLDGVGEWATSSIALGDGRSLTISKEIHFPHSLGLLYSAFTYYTGFRVNSGEYKVMGLAPYGSPRYAQRILDNLIDVKPDGSFRMDMSYFDYCTGLTMTNERFHRLFEGPPRHPDSGVTQRDMDLAASIQAVTEEVISRIATSIALETGARNLCLSGGVALNCVANGRLLRERQFQEIWVQPAAGDAGGALGAAFAAYHLALEQPRTIASPSRDAMKGSYLGPEFAQADIERRLEAIGARFQVEADTEFFETCVDALIDGQAIGWFQGRMEFGPRALGARSILADPRSPDAQSKLNLKVKYRESFRPFAPSVLREDVSEWFELDRDSPYMMFVADVQSKQRIALTTEEESRFGIDRLNTPRSTVPAVTHVDYSARVQTVHSDTNPRYHTLLTTFKRRTGCPILVNTSFNIRGEPIVCTPEDAFRCFMGTELDVLAIGNCVLRKGDQDPALRTSYRDSVTD